MKRKNDMSYQSLGEKKLALSLRPPGDEDNRFIKKITNDKSPLSSEEKNLELGLALPVDEPLISLGTDRSSMVEAELEAKENEEAAKRKKNSFENSAKAADNAREQQLADVLKSEAEKICTRLTQLEKGLEKKHALELEFKQQMDEAKRKAANAEGECSKLKGEVETFKKDKAVLEASVGELNKELEITNARLGEAIDARGKMHAEFVPKYGYLHNMIIQLEKQLDQKQALELEIEQLRGSLNVMRHMGDEDDIEVVISQIMMSNG